MTLSEAANWAQVFSLPLTIVLWLITKEHAIKVWKKLLPWLLPVLTIAALLGIYRLGGFNWLAVDVTWPVWKLLVLAFTIPLLAVTAGLIALAVKKVTGPSPGDYRRDIINGIEWRWSYTGRLIDQASISPFCSNAACRSRLELARNSFEGVLLRCPHCKAAHQFDPDAKKLWRRIELEIERRINTGEFKKALAVPE